MIPDVTYTCSHRTSFCCQPKEEATRGLGGREEARVGRLFALPDLRLVNVMSINCGFIVVALKGALSRGSCGLGFQTTAAAVFWEIKTTIATSGHRHQRKSRA